MNFNEVKEIINIFDKSSLRFMELNLDNCHICMDKNSSKSKEIKEEVQNEKPVIINEEKNIITENIKKAESKEGNFLKSPIVGTFYSASSPENDDFVKVGDKVKKGDVLCIIESMKLMNEIESDFDGEIAEILVNNGEVVEYGQNLFRII